MLLRYVGLWLTYMCIDHPYSGISVHPRSPCLCMSAPNACLYDSYVHKLYTFLGSRSLSLSLCLSLCLSVSFCLCLSVSAPVCLSVCLSVGPSVRLSVSVSLSPSLSVRLSVCVSVCLCLCLSLCLSLSVSVGLSVSLVSLSLLSLCLCFSLSLCLCLSLSPCLCLSLGGVYTTTKQRQLLFLLVSLMECALPREKTHLPFLCASFCTWVPVKKRR